MQTVNRTTFPSIKRSITISSHCENRLKQRVNLKTKEKRKKFIKDAARESIPIKRIPKLEKYKEFNSYLAQFQYKKKLSNQFCKIFLYKDFILFVSENGVVITLIKLEEKFRNIYNSIKGYLNLQRSLEQYQEERQDVEKDGVIHFSNDLSKSNDEMEMSLCNYPLSS